MAPSLETAIASLKAGRRPKPTPYLRKLQSLPKFLFSCQRTEPTLHIAYPGDL